MSVESFRDLIVWQKAIGLVKRVYDSTRAFPDEERFGLTNQMRRAAVSIPSNIAEGQARPTVDYAGFLRIARGSLAELETQIVIARELNYLSEERATALFDTVDEVSRLLSGLQASLARKKSES